MLSTEDRRRAEGLDAALEKAPMLERPVLVYWPTLACLSWPPQPVICPLKNRDNMSAQLVTPAS
jgi:hypothetical protein